MTMHKTPDGRVSRSNGPRDPAEHLRHRTAPPPLGAFVEACHAVLPGQSLNADGRIGFFLFLLGAADRLWLREGLDDTRFPPFAAQLLQSQGVAAEPARALSQALAGLGEVDCAREILLEGARVMDDWRESHDPGSIMRLGQLVIRWQRERTLSAWMQRLPAQTGT